jgi:hypothetical protein
MLASLLKKMWLSLFYFNKVYEIISARWLSLIFLNKYRGHRRWLGGFKTQAAAKSCTIRWLLQLYNNIKAKTCDGLSRHETGYFLRRIRRVVHDVVITIYPKGMAAFRRQRCDVMFIFFISPSFFYIWKMKSRPAYFGRTPMDEKKR